MSAFQPVDHLSFPLREGGLLILPLKGEAASLESGAYLDPRGRGQWEELCLRGTLPEDSAEFIKVLVNRDLLDATDSLQPGIVRRSTRVLNDHASSSLSGAEAESLLRGILETGTKVLFLARGRSMRPIIPDGTELVISPVEFEEIGVGDVLFYNTPTHRLVAHRVIAIDGDQIHARGDSASRIDVLRPSDIMGRVIARRCAKTGREISLCHPRSKRMGRIWNSIYALSYGVVRRVVFVSAHTFGRSSMFRRCLSFVLRAICFLLRQLTGWLRRMEKRLSVIRSASLSTEDKDQSRRALYARRSMTSFTSLDENLQAGLTLIEEVIFSRHSLPPGKTLVVGCGPGRESVALAKRGFSVIGIDREEAMLKRARKFAGDNEVNVRFEGGDAMGFGLSSQDFDYVVLFSGLFNMILPRQRRIQALVCAKEHLVSGGRILLTFLSQYVDPLTPSVQAKTWLRSLNVEHEPGDTFLINEAVHIFPSAQHLEDEAHEAGLETLEIYRDQRAYDREHGQVKGYAILGVAKSR